MLRSRSISFVQSNPILRTRKENGEKRDKFLLA